MRLDRDALVVGLTVVPGLFSRNRMFSFFAHPEVRAARARAAQLRGVLRHLRGASGDVEIVEWNRHASGAPSAVLHYRIAQIRLSRRIEMSVAEAACVGYLSHRGGVTVLPPHEADRGVVEGALSRLSASVQLPALPAL